MLMGAGLDIGAGAHARPEREILGLGRIDQILIGVGRQPYMHFIIRDVVGGRGSRSCRGAAGDLGDRPFEFTVVIGIYLQQGRVPR